MTPVKRWVLAALLLLAGCAVVSPPHGDSGVAPRFSKSAFIARDGVALPLREWDAKGPANIKPRAIVVALHGMSDYSNAFDGAGRDWAASGITTIAYDQRGFGAGPDPGSWAGSETMRRDFSDCVAAARARWPGVPVFGLGESMGGAVILTAMTDAAHPQLEGVILVSPAVWSRDDMPLSYRVALFLAAHLAPGFVLSNNSGASIAHIVASDNVEMLRALGRDPLFQKQTRVAALAGLVDLMDQARRAPDHLESPPPILFLHGDKDQIIPQAPSRAVIEELGSRADVRDYAQGYHMLLRDLDGAKVRQDVADWIVQRAGNKSPAGPL